MVCLTTPVSVSSSHKDSGEQWKQHRRVVNPSFSHETYVQYVTLIHLPNGSISRFTLVHSEVERIYNELVDAEGWIPSDALSQSGTTHVDIPVVTDLTIKVRLLILAELF
jgi:hypothetical protein